MKRVATFLWMVLLSLLVCGTNAIPQVQPSRTPEELEFYRLLTRSYLLGRELVPLDRSFLLLRLSDITQNVNPGLSCQWAQEAFQTAVESSNAWDRLAAQKSALVIVSRSGDPELAMRMFTTLGDLVQPKSGQAGEDPRADAASAIFPAYYQLRGVNGLGRIRAVAEWLAATGEYPYVAVGELINHLVKDKARNPANQIFNEAIAAYNRGTHTQRGDDQFVHLITAVAGNVDVTLIRSALDGAYAKLSTPDTSNTDPKERYHARVYTTGGSFETSDRHKRVLIKLLPIAEQFYPELAKRIESVVPAQGKELFSESSVVVGTGQSEASSVAAETENLELSRLVTVQRLSLDNQSESLRLAQSLNTPAIRARALAAVAAGATSPESRLSMLGDASKVLNSAQPDRNKVAAFADLASAYVNAGRFADARDLVRAGLELGSDLLEQQQDTSGDVPIESFPTFDDVCELAKIGARVDRQVTTETVEALRNGALRAYLLAELAAGSPFALIR